MQSLRARANSRGELSTTPAPAEPCSQGYHRVSEGAACVMCPQGKYKVIPDTLVIEI